MVTQEALAQANERTQRRRQIVEREIYEHAARLFAERGFAATSLQDVAESMGLTRTAIYHYVNSKDALLEKLVTEVTLEGVALLRGIRSRADLTPQERLGRAIHEMVRRNAENPARFRLWHVGQMELTEPLAGRNERAKRDVLRELRGIIDDGIEAGAFRPVDTRTAALAILGMCNWIAWWFRPSPDHPTEPVSQLYADLALQGLTAATPAASRAAPAPGTDAAPRDRRAVARAALRDLRAQLDRLEAAIDEAEVEP